jgi:hypothetical protein
MSPEDILEQGSDFVHSDAPKKSPFELNFVNLVPVGSI